MIKRIFHSHINRNFSIATIWIKGGSNKDNFTKKGLNNILCSTLVRECEGFENLQLADHIESYGAELNHEVFEDGISISIKSINQHFNKLFPLLNLIVEKPTLSFRQFKKVKLLTINSLKKEKENPFNICFEKWRKMVYSNHPYAFHPMGCEKDVSRITYEDVLNEFDKFKHRKKFLISNNLNVKALIQEVTDQKESKNQNSFSNNFSSQENRFVSTFNNSNQIIMMIGNQTCPRQSKEYLPLKVLESHLSYGMSSVLFKLFREKNGITYDVGVFNPVREWNAPFLIYLSVANKNGIFAFELLSELWRNLLFSLITDEEIWLAKEKLKSSFLVSSQSLEEILQRKIQLISYGISDNDSKAFIEKTKNISQEEIQRLIKKYFSKPFLSICGEKPVCEEIKERWLNSF